MMHNKNIYKKLCTATISLGLLFSIGQFAYAHNPNLRAAEQLAASEPTIENLTYLRSLYEIDIQQHYANGENDKAEEAEHALRTTKLQINNILSHEKAKIQEAQNKALKNQTLEDWQCAVDSFDNIFKMLIIAGDNSSLVSMKRAWLNTWLGLASMYINNAKTADNYGFYAMCYEQFIISASGYKELEPEVMAAKIEAAKARVEQAEIMLDNDETLENYENLAQRWDALAELAQSHPTYSQNVLEYQIEAAMVRAQQTDLMIEEVKFFERTAEQYEALAQRWDAVVELAKPHPTYSQNVLEYQIEAAKARAEQAEIIADNDFTPDSYELLAQRWDALAELAQSYPTYSENALEYQIEAANARAQQTDLMVEEVELSERTAEQYEALVQRWDAVVELAKLHPAYSQNVLEYQIEAARARSQQAKIISQNDETSNNYENLVQCYDELFKLFNLKGLYADAIGYKRLSRNAMLAMADLTEKPNEKCNIYEKVIRCNDDAAAFAEEFRLPNNTVFDFKLGAAKSRMNLAKIILENNQTNLQNYDNWVRHCEELVQLFDGNERDNLRIDAAIARIDAAIARAKRAKFIAEQHKTVEDYDILIQRWNEVVENFKAFSATWAEKMPHGVPEPPENIQGLEDARHEAELARDIHMYLMDEEEIFRQGTFLSIAALLGRK